MNNQIKEQRERAVQQELNKLLSSASAFWKRYDAEYQALSARDKFDREIDVRLTEKGGE